MAVCPQMWYYYIWSFSVFLNISATSYHTHMRIAASYSACECASFKPKTIIFHPQLPILHNPLLGITECLISRPFLGRFLCGLHSSIRIYNAVRTSPISWYSVHWLQSSMICSSSLSAPFGDCSLVNYGGSSSPFFMRFAFMDTHLRSLCILQDTEIFIHRKKCDTSISWGMLPQLPQNFPRLSWACFLSVLCAGFFILCVYTSGTHVPEGTAIRA